MISQRAVLQPCSGIEARAHYEETVERHVPLDECAPFLDATELETLEAVAGEQGLLFWGATPGEKLQHVPKWERIIPGDVILFSRDGGIFSWALVTQKVRNSGLARHLWGTKSTKNGVEQTWELMFSITPPKPTLIPYRSLNRLIGRAEGAVVQEFSVLSEEASEGLIQALDLQDNDFQPEVSIETYLGSVIAPEFEAADKEVITRQRVEQRFLRKFLFGSKKSGSCDLCRREFPVGFLVAAHIKKRALCTEEEKLDFESIVMANCRFGCDELFGRGFIGVSDAGQLVWSEEILNSTTLLDYAKEYLPEKKVEIWHSKPGSRRYFADHFRGEFKS